MVAPYWAAQSFNNLGGPVVFRDPFDKVGGGQESDMAGGTEDDATHQTSGLV
jgi:hypothetical protein